MDIKSIGKRISFYRQKANLTTKQLSKRVGISQIYLNEIERGNKTPSLKTYISICNELKIGLDTVAIDSLDVSNDVMANEIVKKAYSLSFKNPKLTRAVLDALLEN
jgi:putative regulatory protein